VTNNPVMQTTPRRSRTFAAATVVAAGLALAGGIAAVGVASAKGGDGGQNVFVDASCTQPGTGYTGYNKSGDKVTFIFGVRNDASTEGWHVVATDAGATLVDQTLPAFGNQWSLVRNWVSPKGVRTVVVTADALDGTNHCDAVLTYKV
jgi:hypothetical protein